jgi:hypothetical protein
MTSEIASDFVVNPYTGRLIKKHSKTYERLVNAQLLNEDRPSTSEENMILKAQNNEEAKTLQMKLNKNLQKNKIVTRRGSSILKASRRPTRKEIIDRVSDIATNVVTQNRDELLDSDMNDEELDEYIKKMIQLKLVDNNSVQRPKKITTKALSSEERIRERQQELNDEDYE